MAFATLVRSTASVAFSSSWFLVEGSFKISSSVKRFEASNAPQKLLETWSLTLDSPRYRHYRLYQV